MKAADEAENTVDAMIMHCRPVAAGIVAEHWHTCKALLAAEGSVNHVIHRAATQWTPARTHHAHPQPVHKLLRSRLQSKAAVARQAAGSKTSRRCLAAPCLPQLQSRLHCTMATICHKDASLSAAAQRDERMDLAASSAVRYLQLGDVHGYVDHKPRDTLHLCVHRAHTLRKPDDLTFGILQHPNAAVREQKDVAPTV